MKSYDNLYNALGALFYAIVSVDNRINPKELEPIKRYLEKKQFPVNDNNDAPEKIWNKFDIMLHLKTPAYAAFKEFTSYKQSHELEFTNELKKWIWQIADEITYSFAGKNKSEVIILSKLKSILQRKLFSN